MAALLRVSTAGGRVSTETQLGSNYVLKRKVDLVRSIVAVNCARLILRSNAEDYNSNY